MSINNEYYDFMNITSYLQKKLVKGTYSYGYLKWFKQIGSVALSMFKYKNLPKGLTSEIIEKALMFKNSLCLYKSKSLGVILAYYRTCGIYDIYWKPTKVDIIALNGSFIASRVPFEDIVLVRDNMIDAPLFLVINEWVSKILEKEKTLDINMILARLPTILCGDKTQTTELKALLQKIGNFEPFAISSKNFKDKIDQFDIKLPCSFMDIYEIMDKYKDLANASIGIYSTDEKRERIISAEIQANNDEVDFIYNERLEERRRFVNECNAKFGTNIELIESYADNRKDEIELLREQVKAEEQEKAKAQNLIETDKGGNNNE